MLRLQRTKAPIYCWHISFVIFFIKSSQQAKTLRRNSTGRSIRKRVWTLPKKEVCSKMKYKERKLYFCEVCQTSWVTSILAMENCLTFNEFFKRFYWFSLEVSLDFCLEQSSCEKSLYLKNCNKVTRQWLIWWFLFKWHGPPSLCRSGATVQTKLPSTMHWEWERTEGSYINTGHLWCIQDKGCSLKAGWMKREASPPFLPRQSWIWSGTGLCSSFVFQLNNSFTLQELWQIPLKWRGNLNLDVW